MKKILLVVFVLIAFNSTSQESDLGNWWIYFGNKKLNSKWNIHHEVQYRNYNIAGDLEQLLLRTGVGYNLVDNNANLLLGYGFIRSENYFPDSSEKFIVNEHRIYQQFVSKQNFGRFYISHRYRFEQRFVEDNFRLRFRYFLATKIALTNSKLIDKTFYLSFYNELFIGGKSPLFDRNRIYGGFGYQFNTNLKCEVGYMNQLFENGSRDQANLIVSYSF
ncbi:MAG: DUF2490 domain-containing protein [Flavobacteriales bacterium]